MDTLTLADGNHTLELRDNGVMQKTVEFMVDNSAQRQAESPKAQNCTSNFENGMVTAALTAVSPVGEALDISFFTAEALPVSGTVISDNGEVAMTSHELDTLTQEGALTTSTVSALPTHTFKVDVGDYTGDVVLSWSGRTCENERIRLSVLDPVSGGVDSIGHRDN